ncbi:MAG TPA: nucleotide exchange factor GrpE [Pyrinomonadaceae bacterium]|jgi:molecular chaperone GrpE|nr:nucleotide exchange factor GrpE [Pyrinomonadaceae bacterium]
MKEKGAAAEARDGKSASSSAEEIRVTDRRRVNLKDVGGNSDAPDTGEGESVSGESPSPKPGYVQQLEERARSAEQKLLEVQSRFEQLRAQLQRETDETRARLNRAADERARREKADFIAAILPVADNLQRALEAAEGGSSFESLLEGVRGTASNFLSALEAAGVEPVPAVGQPFDPQLHEAVDTIEVDAERDGVVTAEYGRGYRMGERLLRPARVQVGRATRSGMKMIAE